METSNSPFSMNYAFRKAVWLALFLAVASCVALEFWPRAEASSRLARLPMRGLGYAGRDLPLNESEAAVFRRVAAVKRLYQVGSTRFVLLAVDGGGDRHAIHDPLYCFRGAGWEVTGGAVGTIPGGQTKVLRLAKGGQTTEVVFWISDGESRHASAVRAWWQSTLFRLNPLRVSRSPVLFLLQPMTGSTVNWDEALRGIPELLLM